MAQLSPTQQVWRGRIETGLRFAAPFLDLVLIAGDRVSRMVEPADTAPLAGIHTPRDAQRALDHGRH